MAAEQESLQAKGFLYGKPVTQSLSDSSVVQSKDITYVFQASRHASESEYSVSAGISRLLSSCSPSAVSRFVIAVLVGVPIQTQSFGTLPHVLQEINEVPPSFAHGNSSSSVRREKGGIGICASLDHILPTCVCSAVSLTVNRISVPSEAPTRSGVPTTKCFISNFYFAPTLTLAQTPAMLFSGGKVLNDKKPSKCLTFKGYSFARHNGSFSTVVFSGESRGQSRGSLRLFHTSMEGQA